MKVISIVIAVYKNEGELNNTYQSIKNTILESLPAYDYEFIFTDDGSDDNSFNELMEIRSKDKKVKVQRFSKNFGQFAAINAGMHKAQGDLIVNIAADLQDPPEMIVKMVKEIENGAEIVIANRQSRNDTFLQNITSRVHWKLMRISNPNFPKGGFDFWMFNKKALEAYKMFNDRVRSNQVDVLSIGFKTLIIPYERRKREIGKSQYNFKKRIIIAINQVLNISYWPLRLASAFGFLFTISGFLYALRIAYSYFVHDKYPFEGWAPLMIMQLVIGGIIIIMLGIIGEYLWRIFYETKQRPLYFIKEEHFD